MEILRNEQKKFRDEMSVLEEKIDGILASRSGTKEQDTNNRVLKVHIWDDTTLPMGYREKKLYSVEGFSTHPRTTLVDSAEDADLIAWVSVRGNTEKEIPPTNHSNVVLLDYADGCNVHQKRGELKHMIGYFKRSFVLRDKDSVYVRNCTLEEVTGGIFPFSYSGLEALVNKDIHKERNTLITSVLRTEGTHNKVRSRVVDWTKSFIEQHGLKNKSSLGDVGSGYSASDFDHTYLSHLADSKIIVTCNPWNWEGDFRLWEALLSGALVMVDKMAIPHWMPHPFVHKKHLIFYDTTNQSEFNSLLEITLNMKTRQGGSERRDTTLYWIIICPKIESHISWTILREESRERIVLDLATGSYENLSLARIDEVKQLEKPIDNVKIFGVSDGGDKQKGGRA
eukprot:scaffold2996_cov122-Skeletonema_marinoi.AAC.1